MRVLVRVVLVGFSALFLRAPAVVADTCNPPACPPKYELIVAVAPSSCPPPWDVSLQPHALSNLDHVCGHHAGCDFGQSAPDFSFFWSPKSGLVTLPTPAPYKNSRANDVNDLDQVCGNLVIGLQDTPGVAYVWKDGNYTLIPPPEGWMAARGLAINNKGWVVGELIKTGQANPNGAFFWDGTTTTVIEPPEGSRCSISVIDDEGLAVGWTGNSPNLQLFTWKGGKVELLGKPDGWNSARPTGINDTGTIVGWGGHPDGTEIGTAEAFTWNAGTWTVLPPLYPGQRSHAYSITFDGLVVGTSDFLPPPLNTLWVGGQPFNLQSIIEADGTIDIASTGARLNDLGDFLCDGSSGGVSGFVIMKRLPCRMADLDCSHAVDGDDLGILLNEWGKARSSADLDANGTVDGGDLGLLLADWG